MLMKFSFITLGCKVNQYESQAMAELLENAGFSPALSGECPDIIVLNSCTVTATSDQKVRQLLRRARRNNPEAILILTGCMPQAFPDTASHFEEADIVLGILTVLPCSPPLPPISPITIALWIFVLMLPKINLRRCPSMNFTRDQGICKNRGWL